MEKEIKRTEIGQLESLNVAFANAAEMFFDASRSNFAHQQRIEVFAQGNHTDIRRITLVARPRVRQFGKSYFQFYVPVSGDSAREQTHFRCDFAFRNQRRPVRNNLFHFRPAAGESGD